MGIVHIGALIEFTYPGRRKYFSQLVHCDEKYFQLKLINVKRIMRIF
jgi:hypothetical protein